MSLFVFFGDECSVDGGDASNDHMRQFSPQRFEFEHQIGFADWDEVDGAWSGDFWFLDFAFEGAVDWPFDILGADFNLELFDHFHIEDHIEWAIHQSVEFFNRMQDSAQG